MITNDTTTKWQTTNQAGVACGSCGKIGTCTVSPDRTAFKCWRDDGRVHQTAATTSRPHRHRADRPKVTRQRSRAHSTAEAAIEAARATTARGILAGTWSYTDVKGKELMQVARFNLPDGDKAYRPVFRAKDGWRIGDPPGLLPLYGLSFLPTTGAVYIFEGEKATDAARALGLTATTSAHGSSSAGKTDWTPLAGRDLVILPDNDDPGEKYAREVAVLAARLDPPAQVKIVKLPGLPYGGDVVEFIAARGGAMPESTRREIEALADATAHADPSDLIGGPVMTCLADIQPEDVKWLWEGNIAVGKLTLICGNPGLGKGFITLDMAAHVTTGASWPDGSPCPKGSVILISAEDDLADTIRPRLDKAGADVRKIASLDAVRRIDDSGKDSVRGFTLADVPALADALRQRPDCKLVVIDPVSAYLSNADSHNNAEVRGLLAPLAKLASERRVAVVMVTHLSKGGSGQAIYRAMGSLAFVAAARSAWLVVKDRDDPERRLVLPIKNNIGNDATGMAYSIVDGAVVWEPDPVTVTADEAMSWGPDAGGDSPGPEPEARRDAAEWLEEILASGPMETARIKAEATASGYAWRTVHRAKDDLGIRPFRDPAGSWMWKLPTTVEPQQIGENPLAA